jgi:hypothetical protein
MKQTKAKRLRLAALYVSFLLSSRRHFFPVEVTAAVPFRIRAALRFCPGEAGSTQIGTSLSHGIAVTGFPVSGSRRTYHIGMDSLGSSASVSSTGEIEVAGCLSGLGRGA